MTQTAGSKTTEQGKAPPSPRPHASRASEPGWAREYQAMLEAYAAAGGDPAALQMPRAATLVVSANRVLAASEVPGIHFAAE